MTDLNLMTTLQKVKDVLDGIDHSITSLEDPVIAPGDENIHVTPPEAIQYTAGVLEQDPMGPGLSQNDKSGWEHLKICPDSDPLLRKFSISLALEMCWRCGDLDNLGKEPDKPKQLVVYKSMFKMAKCIESYVKTGEFSNEGL